MACDPGSSGLHAVSSLRTRLHAVPRKSLISLCTRSLHGVLHSVHSVTHKSLELLCTRFARGARTGSPHTPLCAKAHLGACASATKEQNRRRQKDGTICIPPLGSREAARPRVDCFGNAVPIPGKCVMARHCVTASCVDGPETPAKNKPPVHFPMLPRAPRPTGQARARLR